MPNPGLAHSFLDKHIASPFASSGTHTAILPIMLSDNATPGTAHAAAVRPEPCLASWEPVFAGVMLRCAGDGCERVHARERSGRAVCGAQKERGTLSRCVVAGF
jgi:hypothetical protein